MPPKFCPLAWLMPENMEALPSGWPCWPSPEGPPFAASKAALYEEAGANEGICCERKGELERGPNEGGELMEEPKEALKGECELPACCGPGPEPAICGCCCWDEPEPPVSEPNGNEGEMEKVEPPRVNDGPPPDWPANKPCCWLELSCSNGDWRACCCCCCCGCCCCDCGGLNRLLCGV